MATKIYHGTYNLYHRNPDGSLTFVKKVAYSFRRAVTPKKRTRTMAMTEAMINAANAKRRAEAATIEALADAACEEGAR